MIGGFGATKTLRNGSLGLRGTQSASTEPLSGLRQFTANLSIGIIIIQSMFGNIDGQRTHE
jgi:hypothetical protein